MILRWHVFTWLDPNRFHPMIVFGSAKSKSLVMIWTSACGRTALNGAFSNQLYRFGHSGQWHGRLRANKSTGRSKQFWSIILGIGGLAWNHCTIHLLLVTSSLMRKHGLSWSIWMCSTWATRSLCSALSTRCAPNSYTTGSRRIHLPSYILPNLV